MTAKQEKQEKKKNQFLEKLKKIKHIEIYIALGFVAILLLIYFAGGSGTFSLFKSSSNKQSSDTATTFTYEERTEARLRELLSSIKGVSDAKVMINFESTPEIVIAYIENESVKASTDSNGIYTEDKTSSSNPVIITQSGGQLALVLKEIAPSISGVMIVAQGADDVKVKLNIINAVSVLLNINPNKIAVLES